MMATDEMTLRDMRALEMRQIELERQKRKSKMNNNIDKKSLGELIQFHQQQIAANQRQIDELRGQFEPEPLPEVKPMFGQALRIENTKALLTHYGVACEYDRAVYGVLEQGNCFISKEAAELEAEKRRLRQFARVRMAESWDDKMPREAGFLPYCINLMGGQVKICAQSLFSPLYFPSYAEAQSFFEEVGLCGIYNILSL